jgi:hypothetical protein
MRTQMVDPRGALDVLKRGFGLAEVMTCPAIITFSEVPEFRDHRIGLAPQPNWRPPGSVLLQ